MLKNATIINDMSPIELGNLIELKIEAVFLKLKKEVNDLNLQSQVYNEEIFLNKKAAAAYLNISTVTLSKYIKAGFIKAYSLGGSRLRFKRSELDKSMKALRSNTL